MATGISTYSFNDVIVTFNGVRIQGFSEDGITIEPVNAERFTSSVGADGEVCHSLSGDTRYRVTVSLMQCSLGNQTLANVFNADINTPGGAGIGVFRIDNLRNGDVYHSSFARIVSIPSITLSTEVGTQEWIIEACDLSFEPGALQTI